MSDLMQSVLDALQPQQVEAMSRRLGTSAPQTERAIQAALPLLIGQMARNSAQPQGAESLQRALERDHAPAAMDGLMGVLGSVMGGGRSARGNDAISDGLGILGHVFGQRQERVAQSVGRVGGMDGQQSSQLLAMLAPVVMAALARMMQNRGGGASALGGLLGNENQALGQGGSGGLLGAVLDRDGDGDVDVADLLGNGQLLGGLFGRR